MSEFLLDGVKPRGYNTPMRNAWNKEPVRITCIFLLLLVIAFYDVVFLGKTFKVTTANSQALPTGAYGQQNNKPAFIPVNGTDSPVMEEPVFAFIKQNIRRGILPLWNPHQACGYPLIGMMEIGLFFPVNWIMYCFPEILSWDILILTRLLLAGLFVYWFMRTMAFKEIPSLCSGIIFMLSGPMILLQYWTANVDLLTPVLLIAIDRLIRRMRLFDVAFLGLVVGLTFLAGHPEHIFLVNAYGFAFFVFRLFSLRKTRGQARRIIGGLCLGYLLGVGLSCIVLFPFLRNLISEFWSGHPPSVGLLMEEQRGRALTLALPYFFQEANLTYQWSFAGWWGGYLGIVPLGLAFLSLFYKQKRGLNYFFAGIAFIIIGKEYGLPIINWLGLLPIFNLCRYAIHTPVLAALSVAIAAGMGVRTILSGRKVFLKGLAFSLILLLIVDLHLIFLQKSEDFMLAVKASLSALGILMIFQAILFIKDKRLFNKKAVPFLLAAVVFGELFLYVHRERPHRFESFGKVPYIEFLKSSPEKARSYGNYWAFYPNTATGFGVDDFGYFQSLVPNRFVLFVNNLLLRNYFRNDLRPPAVRAIPIGGRDAILDLLNVRYIITPASDDYAKQFSHLVDVNKTLKKVYSGEVKVFERPTALPRAFIVHRAFFEINKQKSFALVNQIGEQLKDVVVINFPANSPDTLKILKLLQTSPARDNSSAVIAKYTPNEVLVHASFENAGFLVLSDAYHPDWKVYVNGKPWKIFQANGLLRAVFLPKGRFQVKFVFHPDSFYTGAQLSAVSLLVLLLLFNARRLGKFLRERKKMGRISSAHSEKTSS